MISTYSFTDEQVEQIAQLARPLDDHDELVAAAAQRKTVLIGEASHGTHEFYAERAAITRRLITEHDFKAVALEGDWPDTWRINEFVLGRGSDQSAEEALGGFERFPSWMWRNDVMLNFVQWLRRHNEALEPHQRAGVYGLDLYSLHPSAERVLDYVALTDPDSLPGARERYACLDTADDDPQRYGHDAALGLRPECEHHLLQQLLELTRRSWGQSDDPAADREEMDAWFDAQQNATVAYNAARYYRAMFAGGQDTWNMRDRHMADTLTRVQSWLRERGDSSKAVVWAHNSHVGDARATQMGRQGQWTLGQLVREEQGYECLLIGFTTSRGTVTAAHDWGDPAEERNVVPAIAGSCERLFHQTGLDSFVLLPDQLPKIERLHEPLLERAIGVIYRPQTERQSHYFDTELAHQFDAVIHIDETRALEPLERVAPPPEKDAEETWPFGV